MSLTVGKHGHDKRRQSFLEFRSSDYSHDDGGTGRWIIGSRLGLGCGELAGLHNISFDLGAYLRRIPRTLLFSMSNALIKIMLMIRWTGAVIKPGKYPPASIGITKCAMALVRPNPNA